MYGLWSNHNLRGWRIIPRIAGMARSPSSFLKHGELQNPIKSEKKWVFFGFHHLVSMAISGTDLLEVPTIYFWPIFQAYVREYPRKIWYYMLQYLQFRILKLSSGWWFGTMEFDDFSIILGTIARMFTGGQAQRTVPHLLGTIIPTDELIFFRGVGWNHQPDYD